MTDFEAVDITINDYSDNWGPFIFHMPSSSALDANDGLIPYGSVLQAVNVRAFVGIIRPGAPLASYPEITNDLIDTDVPVAVEPNLVRVHFCYPGSEYKGKQITLMFESTLSTGAKQAFFFNSVQVN